MNNRAGTDPRRARNPGADGVFNNADDVLASPGVARSDAFNEYLRDSVFTLTPQVTPRTANSVINAAHADAVLGWPRDKPVCGPGDVGDADRLGRHRRARSSARP